MKHSLCNDLRLDSELLEGAETHFASYNGIFVIVPVEVDVTPLVSTCGFWNRILFERGQVSDYARLNLLMLIAHIHGVAYVWSI